MKFHKQLIGACLAACALAVSCAAVAAEPVPRSLRRLCSSRKPIRKK